MAAPDLFSAPTSILRDLRRRQAAGGVPKHRSIQSIAATIIKTLPMAIRVPDETTGMEAARERAPDCSIVKLPSHVLHLY